MEFQDRSDTSDILIEVVKQRVWDKLPALYHVEMGYETHIPDRVREALRYVRTATARHVRYVPDFLIVDSQNPDSVYLLEYKCTQTPLYSSYRINQIAMQANREVLSWEDIGQCESDAFDNYVALSEIGIRVAILNYIAYHERLLLCDFIENIEELHRDQVTSATQRGSRTPFVNFDANDMRTLQTFLAETHGIQSNRLDLHIGAVCSELQQQLPTKHHSRSPYARR